MAKLNKDFVRTLDFLKEKYGEDFEILNGLSENHLNHTEFLDNFTQSKTVADASVDSSANVKQKDIVTLRSEISKPDEKLMAYHKIFIEIKQYFGCMMLTQVHSFHIALLMILREQQKKACSG